MLIFVLQSALLLGLAFALGCVLGCVLRGRVASRARSPAAGPLLLPNLGTEISRSAAHPSVSVEDEPYTPPSASRPKRPVVRRGAAKDNLKRIRGIGRQSEKQLAEAGIKTFAQIAAWTPEEQKAWSVVLGFPGRVEREDWAGQAALLDQKNQAKEAGQSASDAKK